MHILALLAVTRFMSSLDIVVVVIFGVKLMFVGVTNFGQIQKIRFVVVKIFQSYSNQFLVISIWSSKLASIFSRYTFYTIKK